MEIKNKIGVISLGCSKNLADMEAVIAEIPNYEIVPIEEAEIVFLNTCAFLKIARDEVYENLKTLNNKKVILIGCMTGTLKESFLKLYPHIYAVVSSANYPQISQIFDVVKSSNKIFAVSEEPIIFDPINKKTLLTSTTYAYVKIAEGCDNKCTYCLIPKLKGKYRSRNLSNILEEVKKLVELGVKEIVLVAQDCGYFGMDIYKKPALGDLLTEINKIKGDFWVRVLYVYPERITEDFLKTIVKNEKICHYLDIPLQHGDSEILKAMGRVSDLNKIHEKIEMIRKIIPNVTLRTSLIVGFPGETEKHFQNLLDFVKKIKFDHVGVFEYSREKGTSSYYLENQVLDSIKSERKGKIMLAQQEISLVKNKKMVGKTVKVLIEKYDENEKVYIGRPEKFAPEVDGEIFIKSKNNLELNKFYDVKVSGAGEYDLEGDYLEL